MVVERLPRLDAVGPMLEFVFVDDLDIDPSDLVPQRWDPATALTGLSEALRVIESAGAVSFEADELEPTLRTLCEDRGWKVGDLFMTIRVAITGRTATPPLFDTMVAIGFDRTIERLRAAREVLSHAKEEPDDAVVTR
jgi:glutamyl-tRNA synthetase